MRSAIFPNISVGAAKLKLMRSQFRESILLCSVPLNFHLSACAICISVFVFNDSLLN